jgi:hypothetical protein
MVQVLPCWQSFSVESQSVLLCKWKRATKCLPVSIFINRLTYHWEFFLHFMANQYPFLVFFATFLFVVVRAADSTFAGDLSSISIVPQSGSFLSSTNFQYQGEALRDVIRSRSNIFCLERLSLGLSKWRHNLLQLLQPKSAQLCLAAAFRGDPNIAGPRVSFAQSPWKFSTS